MARDLFEEAGIAPAADDTGRDLFEAAGIQFEPAKKQSFVDDIAEFGLDMGKRAAGAVVSGVASIPLGIEKGVKSLVRSSVEASGESMVPAGIYNPGIDTDETIHGPETQRDKDARFLAAERAASGIPNLPGARSLAKAGQDGREAIHATTSEATRQAVADSQITGNIFKGEIDFGKDPSVRGFVMQASDVFGSMLPVVVGSLLTKSPNVGGAIGGSMAAGEGAESASRFIAGKTDDELMQQSPFFARLVNGGASYEEARRLTLDKASESAAFLQGTVASVGDRFTGKLVTGKLDPLLTRAAGKSIAGKTAAGAVLSGAEEGVQEVGEGVASDIGVASVVPTKEIGEDSAANLVLGAMGGAPAGAGRGAYTGIRDRFSGDQGVTNQAQGSDSAVINEGAIPEAGQDQAASPARIDGAAAPVVSDTGRPASTVQAAGVATSSTDEAERALREPVNLTALDRADQLGTELQRLGKRMAELSPENGYGPAFDTERNDLAQQAQQIQAERDSIARTWPTAIKGAPTSFSTEAGVKLDGEYALVDADDLVTSHDENLRQNPLFPPELQPRDRSRQASELQVSSIVQRLDPARLGVSADAATGAPIVGADGLVESGNARTIALKRVYQAQGQKAEDYKAWLRQSAAQFGITPEAVDGMRKPVLVRVRATPVNRAEFARQANQSTIQRMSPSEQASADARRLTSLEGLQPDDNGDFSTSYDFIRQFMATLPITEQSDMIESDGRLSTTGYRRMQNAILAKTYGDSPTLRRMTESLDNNLVNVSKALVRAAPSIAAARDRVQAGSLYDADIAPDLVQAVEGLSSIKDKGWTVAQELGQTDLTGPKYSAEASDLLRFLADNIRSPRRIAEFLQRYYEALEAAGDPNQGSLLGDTDAPTRGDLIQQARGTNDGKQETAGPAGQDRQQSEDAQGRGQGAQGDEAAQSAAGAGQPGADGGQAPVVAAAAPAEPAADAAPDAQAPEPEPAPAAENAEAAPPAEAKKPARTADRDFWSYAKEQGHVPKDVPVGSELHTRLKVEFAALKAGKARFKAMTGKKLGGGWAEFARAAGSLGVPRADMPQIKAEHRGALTQFLAARGVTHQAEADLDSVTLRPTQTEFSTEKVKQAQDFEGGERSILISADSYVLDGHHQWLAKLAQGLPIRAIRFDAPMADLLPVVREFPSAEVSTGAAPAAGPGVDQLNAMRAEAIPIARTGAFAKQGMAFEERDGKTAIMFKGKEIAILDGDRSRQNIVKAIQAAMAAPVLTRPTAADVVAQQDRADRAANLDEQEQVRRESEAGAGLFELSREDGRQDTTGDIFNQSREEAPAPAAQGKKKPESAATVNEDVGEQLYANRRNFTGRGIKWDDVRELNDTLKIKEVTKAKVWPRPDYEKLVADGMPPVVARLVKQVYDGLSAGPTMAAGKAPSDADLQRYIDTLSKIREGLFSFVNDRQRVAAFAQGVLGTIKRDASAIGPVSVLDLAREAMDPQGVATVLLRQVWPDQFADGVPTMGRFRRGSDAHQDLAIIGGNKALAAMQFTRPDLSKWVADLGKGWPAKREAWQVQGYRVLGPDEYVLDRYDGARGTVHYIRPVQGRGSWGRSEPFAGGKFALVLDGGSFAQEFDTREAAVEAAREKVKRQAGVGQDIRGTNIEEAERTGPARRQEGEDITSQRLMDTFGFRGVNFGREGWIKQAERQAYLNQAFDGLMDLAEVLGVPPKAMSLSGKLGIAFGAQGKGRFAAHFVPGYNEINLTRTKGAGTLAHEWGHGLDHHFALQAGLEKDAEPFLSEHASKGDKSDRMVFEDGRYVAKKDVPTFGEGIRPEIVRAFRDIYQAMNKRNESPGEAAARRQHAQESAGRRLSQWLRAARLRIEESPASNKADLLAEFDQHAEKLREGDTGDGYEQSGKQAFSTRVAAVRNLIKDATGRVWSLDETNGLDSAASYVRSLAGKQEADGAHEPQKVATQYKSDSRAMDAEKGGKAYWSTPTEMFARAFELYVHDALAQRGQRNTFLTDAQDRAAKPAQIPDTSSATARATGAMRDLYLYPVGQERETLRAAFDALVKTIESRESDDGKVTLLSRIDGPVGGGTLGALDAISKTDDLFSLPKSDATTIEDIAADHDPEIKVRKTDLPGNETMFTLTMPDSTRAFITVRKSGPGSVYDANVDADNNTEWSTGRPGENPEAVPDGTEDVWIDVSNLRPGQNGARVYNIAATFAHNTGRIFIGDPAGLSDEAMRRRAENMLSSALKFGTTRHLAPHPRQTDGATGIGVPPLKWIYGDDIGNIERLMEVTVKALDSAFPAAQKIRYDLDSGQFLYEGADGRTRSVERRDLDRLFERSIANATDAGNPAPEGARRFAGAGWRTVARGAVFRALLRGRGAQGDGAGRATGSGSLLEGLVRQRAQLASAAENERVFYSRNLSGEAGNLPGRITFDDLQSIADRIKAGAPNMPEVHVLPDPSKAPRALREYIIRQDAWYDVEGAMHDGELYLFASGLADEARAEHVLVEHEAAHYGLRAILGTSLKSAMRLIHAQNASVRKAATELQKRGKLSDVVATEEVIVDIPTAQLAQLRGWRKLVLNVRDWLDGRGYTALAQKLTDWLDGTLTQQQRADLFVAELVGAARDYVAGKRPGRAGAIFGTRLSGTLAEDIAKQEAWLQAEARARGFKDIEDLLERDYPTFEKLAELWRKKNPAEALLSRSAPPGGAGKTVADRAEAIIQKKAGGSAPLDAIARAATKVTGVERLTGAIYDRAGALLDRMVPEKVKAGIVSDYGVPEAVIDQRIMLQGRQRVQLRKAGTLIEKLATLTREESRVAYEWMNMDGSDPKAYLSMMQGLPEESVQVLQEVQKLIDDLSQEAVRLGQLDKEAFERNRFAYLRRSYAKHILAQTAVEKAKRSRVISILGDQYKGRGLVQAEPMSKMQAASPDWWGRKLKDGKADTALKGQKFIRLEKRPQPGAGTRALPGMDPAAPGRTSKVVYVPAGQAIPQQFSDWIQADTWEVRDVKGGNVVLWRDFTKDERQQMGEVDEARFAIAKTMHAMIHDVEVGRYLEWLARNYSKAEGQTIPGVVVEASERYRDTFAPNEWVKVPDTKIPGTSVLKYGALAGHYLPGPIWNDLRQVVGGQFRPFGDAYAKILSMWKTSKTALSPAVHMNNVMSNFVMADWQDVHATHVGKALRIILAASGKKGGIADSAAALEVLNRYKDSGGDIGSWVTQEISKEQLDPLLADLEVELAATADQAMDAQAGIYAALQHALGARFPAAWEALTAGKSGKFVGNAAGKLIDLYQAEDDVFRLAAWLKAKEEGADDLSAGKKARRSFLDYNINAPWVQAMRSTAWPFISFTYRAVPLLFEIAGKKPHKLMKIMMLAGGLNALGVLLGGGGDDDERKLLPEEKAGRIWGMVPKLIRMPWNDEHGSPVYLDIRRWVPVGDVFDVGAGNAAVPMFPGLMPGGPLVIAGEIVLNKSAFTGKPLTLETDTAAEKTGKMVDYLTKAFAPNIPLPNPIGYGVEAATGVKDVGQTYSWTNISGSMSGRTDAFGRELSPAQAMASSVGVKLGSYPKDVLEKNLRSKAEAEKSEIDKNISQLKRQFNTGRLSRDEYDRLHAAQMAKKRKINDEFNAKRSNHSQTAP